MRVRHLVLHGILYLAAFLLPQFQGCSGEEEDDDFRYCYDSEVICDLKTACVSFEMVEEEAKAGVCPPGNGKSPFPVPKVDGPQQVGSCECARIEVQERWPEKCRFLDWCAPDAPLVVDCDKEEKTVQKAPYCYELNKTNDTNSTNDSRRLYPEGKDLQKEDGQELSDAQEAEA
jgi:hypothetical protein